MVSAAGANSRSLIYYSKVKGKAEAGLQALALNRLVIFRPALLLGDRKEPRIAEKLFIHFYNAISPLLPVTLQKRIATDSEHLARQMLIEGKKLSTGSYIIEAKDI
jgi:hypothetical protein